MDIGTQNNLLLWRSHGVNDNHRTCNRENMKINKLKPPYISESLNSKWGDAVNYLRTKCAQPWAVDIYIPRKTQMRNINIGKR